MTLKHSSGIYLLAFPDGNYVGQSNDVLARLNDHVTKMENHSHSNRKIRLGYATYGLPTISILCNCSLAELNSAEKYYMAKYNCYPSGYNLIPGGNYKRGVVDVQYLISTDPIKDYNWIILVIIALLILAIIIDPMFIILFTAIGIFSMVAL